MLISFGWWKMPFGGPCNKILKQKKPDRVGNKKSEPLLSDKLAVGHQTIIKAFLL